MCSSDLNINGLLDHFFKKTVAQQESLVFLAEVYQLCEFEQVPARMEVPISLSSLTSQPVVGTQ